MRNETLQRLDARKDFFDRAGGLTPLLAVDTKGGATFVVNSGDGKAGRALFVKRRARETLDLRAALDFLGTLENLRPNAGTLLDIGAGVGTVAISAVLETDIDQAIALEPSPEVCRILRANVALNAVEDQVRVMDLAASDESGSAFMETSDVAIENRLVGAKFTPSKARVVSVEKATLNHLASSDTISESEVGLVWVGTTEHAPEVVAGATALLTSGVPFVVPFKGRASNSGENASRLAELATEHSLLVVDLKDNTRYDPAVIANPQASLRGATRLLLVKAE